jgi:hypothetical protein
MTCLFFDIFGICMLWGIQNQLRFFLRALLGQQVPQHDVIDINNKTENPSSPYPRALY